MAATLAWREIIRGDAVNCFEQVHIRDVWLDRNQEAFGEEITRRTTRVYSVDVNDLPAVNLDVALGYAGDLLSHVLIWVTKLADDIPDDWSMLQHDIVGDIVLKSVEYLALEHAERPDMGAFYHIFLDWPLVGRGYLHGEIRL
ncbi:hypothetical protein CBR_g32020 [Chara braunii]|uniref:Uncharacterized protein n=1 Tax=Chara braunii TaxID=69332 RepID=A0A388LGF7_CHABU|nr:hypothetical protein CBR_g32020 [Chara braunii]|eukprot:GBG81347.1 hypothetical protein CBR_g32020 [Chara braunii]